jgi:hypothetical protein
MKRIGLFLLAVGTWLSQAGTAHAQPDTAYPIAFSYQAGQSTVNLTGSSSSVTVPIYLQEVVNTGSSYSSLIFDDGGLYGGGVRITAASGTAYLTGASNVPVDQTGTTKSGSTTFIDGSKFPAGVSTANPWTGNSGLTSVGSTTGSLGQNTSKSPYNPSVSGATSALTGTIINQSNGTAAYQNGVTGTVNGGFTTYLYYLGTFTFTGSATAGTTVYTLGSNGIGTTTTPGADNGPFDLDLTNSAGNDFSGPTAQSPWQYNGTTDPDESNGTITVTNSVGAPSVPEPGSLALCGFAACSFGVSAWRRRKARLAAELASQDENASPA